MILLKVVIGDPLSQLMQVEWCAWPLYQRHRSCFVRRLVQLIRCLMLNDIFNVFGERDQILQIGLLHLLLLVDTTVIANAILL